MLWRRIAGQLVAFHRNVNRVLNRQGNLTLQKAPLFSEESGQRHTPVVRCTGTSNRHLERGSWVQSESVIMKMKKFGWILIQSAATYHTFILESLDVWRGMTLWYSTPDKTPKNQNPAHPPF